MKAHGHLDLRWSGSVLYVEAFGPFNDEGAAAAAAAYAEIINNRKYLRFSVIEILRDNSLGTPDTMTEVMKVWKFIGENGCQALALVCANNVQRHLAESFLPTFGKVFSSLDEAEKWVANLTSPQSS